MSRFKTVLLWALVRWLALAILWLIFPWFASTR